MSTDYPNCNGQSSNIQEQANGYIMTAHMLLKVDNFVLAL